MSMSKSFQGPKDAQSASNSKKPLSLSHKKLCYKCVDFEAENQYKGLCEKCHGKRSYLKMWSSEVLRIFERDRGVCANCGLDTVALQEEARLAYLKGREYANAHRASVYFSHGYRKEDLHRRMWQIVPKERGTNATYLNSMTLCNPCDRMAKGLRRRPNFKEATGELFPGFEAENKPADSSGYSKS